MQALEASEKDFDSKDHLFNIAYKTSYGKLTAYSYLLEVDEGTANSLDTFGVSFNGKKDKLSYSVEFATQDSSIVHNKKTDKYNSIIQKVS